MNIAGYATEVLNYDILSNATTLWLRMESPTKGSCLRVGQMEGA